MKKITLILALALTAATTYGQGLISFQNSTFQKFYLDGVTTNTLPLTSQAYTFFCAYGSTAGNTDGTGWAFSTGPVYNSTVTGGLLAGNTSFALANAVGGTPIYIELFGFETAAGSFAAAASGGFHFGASTVALVTPSTSPTAGAVIFANTADASHIARFSLNAVPEPSTMVLAGLGIASLAFFRRRKA